jgi:hypothetical protein
MTTSPITRLSGSSSKPAKTQRLFRFVYGEVFAAISRRRSIPRADSRCSIEAVVRTTKPTHSADVTLPAIVEPTAKAVIMSATASTPSTYSSAGRGSDQSFHLRGGTQLLRPIRIMVASHG